jgi:hypothetical protein
MIESMLKKGQSPGWLPRHEAIGNPSGDLCQLNIIPNKLYYGAKYIPFADGGINWIQQDGHDVISYNFTGCLMAQYNDDGVQKVCHVSTGLGKTDCKKKWNERKKNFSYVKEYRPSDFIPKDMGGLIFAGCYGVITTSGTGYAIIIGSNKAMEYTIVDIKMMTPIY